MHANVDDPSPRLLSFQESLGRFLVVSPKGQLFALDDVRIAEDYSKVVPGICPADFHVATTVGLKLDESNLTLVLQPRDQASAYFLTRLPGGASNKPIKVTVIARPQLTVNEVHMLATLEADSRCLGVREERS